MDQSGREAQGRILDYWRAIELLSPQALPKEDPSHREFPVFRLDPREPLPWSANRPINPDRARRFVLYSGVFSLSTLRSVLLRTFGKDARSFDRYRGGSSCVLAVQLAEDGRPLFETLVIASCTWALSQTLHPGAQNPGWLEGFAEWNETQHRRIEQQWAVRQDDEEGLKLLAKYKVGRRLSREDLDETLQMLLGTLHLGRTFNTSAHFVKAYWVPQARAFEPSDAGFLNSFFIDDLARVSSALRSDDAGTALSQVFLPPAEINDEQRIDVRRSESALWDRLAPDGFPRGRWPSTISMAPYFSQQFAINSASALTHAQEGSVLGVNGPPGTGKTTLLRELVASVIVRRAQALAALRRPSDAFAGQVVWRSDRYTRAVSLWKQEFLGFEMVVASNNNRAVENVTLEIPSAAAIDPEWSEATDYFSDFATRLQQKTKGGGEAWALIAARFGNKKNRKQFRDNFWYQDHEIEQPATRAQRGFAEYLRSVKARPSTWKDAVHDFQSALAAEERIRKIHAEVWTAMSAFKEAAEKLKKLEEHVADCKAMAEAAADKLAHAELNWRQVQQRHDLAFAKRKQHQAFKPTLVDAVFSMGTAYRDWHVEDSRYAARIAAAETECERAAASLAASREQQLISDASLSSAQREFAAQRKAVDDLDAGRPADWPQSTEARELSSPWFDEAWNRARTSLFIKALHLHRAFIECSSQSFRRNMWAAMDLLSGKIPSGLDQPSAESAWATLFFVVPVISTTFASFSRLFRHLGRESIGWLLIDEAGQTTPQAAIGAIWRSKRVLATGDPLQLEPISKLPFTSQEALRNHFGVDEIWRPSRISAQWLVDRVSRYGTWLQSIADDTPVWVGCPLRVHRRCERPMFDLSNEIAYNGQMVYATPALPGPALEPSRWIHVSSDIAHDHWIPEEGLVLTVLLTDIFAAGQRPASVLLLTPFRSVALQLRRIARKFGIKKAGTIHVAQGTEADVVVLVLGSNPRSDAAREWASERPNLLNVAVSRAKRRIYIIGNRELWQPLPHFSEAARSLCERSLEASI